MRIVCPACAAEYEVPASRVAAPRKVRCARCGGEWRAGGESEQPPVDRDKIHRPEEPDPRLAPQDAPPPMTAMDRLTAMAPPRQPPRGLRLAWIMSVVTLIVLISAVIVWRQPLVRAWPPGERILGAAEPAAPASVPDSARSATEQHAKE